jgi:hypothetical protein
MKRIETVERIIEFDDSQEIKNAVFEELIKSFYMENEAFNGESIAQNDDCQIYAAHILGKIADKIIKFKCIWK